MPYTITTLPPGWADYAKQYGIMEAAKRAMMPRATRRAVATLDEARNELAGYCPVPEHPGRPISVDSAAAVFADQVRALPADGGSIGPLPDGTVIEVTRVSWAWLGERANYAAEQRVSASQDIELQEAFIDAYNTP